MKLGLQQSRPLTGIISAAVNMLIISLQTRWARAYASLTFLTEGNISLLAISSAGIT